MEAANPLVLESIPRQFESCFMGGEGQRKGAAGKSVLNYAEEYPDGKERMLQTLKQGEAI
jgi:hypothetical protein